MIPAGDSILISYPPLRRRGIGGFLFNEPFAYPAGTLDGNGGWTSGGLAPFFVSATGEATSQAQVAGANLHSWNPTALSTLDFQKPYAVSFRFRFNSQTNLLDARFSFNGDVTGNQWELRLGPAAIIVAGNGGANGSVAISSPLGVWSSAYCSLPGLNNSRSLSVIINGDSVGTRSVNSSNVAAQKRLSIGLEMSSGTYPADIFQVDDIHVIGAIG